jgi:hypothetical protein
LPAELAPTGGLLAYEAQGTHSPIAHGFDLVGLRHAMCISGVMVRERGSQIIAKERGGVIHRKHAGLGLSQMVAVMDSSLTNLLAWDSGRRQLADMWAVGLIGVRTARPVQPLDALPEVGTSPWRGRCP